MKSKKEIRLLQCRIVDVISYFDDEGEIPWDFIERNGDGRFKAIATHIRPRPGDIDIACEHVLGVYGELKVARDILHEHNHREWRRMTAGLTGLK